MNCVVCRWKPRLMTAIPPSPNQTLPRQLQPQHVDGLHNDLERLPPPAANDQLPDLEYAGLYEHQQPLKEPIEQHRKGQFTAVSAGSGGVLLLFLYTFLDANKAVMVYWSYSARSPDERYSAGSMVLAENVLSLVASLGISLACLGSKQCHSMWSTRYFLRLIPSALSFTMARILGLRALQYIDAGTLKVMSQAVLPTNAILSSLLMGTKSVTGSFVWHFLCINILILRYSVIQWQCLLLVFVTTAAFYEIRVFEERQFATISQGLPLFLATLTFTSIGAVYSEKCIKAGGDVPFYYQKAMLSIASCLCVGTLIVIAPVIDGDATRRLSHLFDHWDERTLIALVSWTLSSWTAGIVVKWLSVVIKNIAQCVAILITYFITSIFLLHEYPSFAAVLLACAVLQSSFMYVSTILPRYK